MKMSILTSAVVIVLLSLNADATKYEFIAKDSSVETKICVLAGSNNKSELRQLIRKNKNESSHFSSRAIANNVTCNDMVMAHFAHKYDALDTFKYLNNFTKGENKIPTTSIEIQDITAVSNNKNEETKIIYVSSSN